jgi:UDP-GlcNAc:undecaprenyl-phosphate/decaprenyl-phosphate GlcNAc-1-phosphate transferase
VNALSAFYLAAVAFLATAALTPLVRMAALRYGRVAAPRTDRWHQAPTVVLGGIAVFGGTCAALVFVPRWSPLFLAVAVGSAGAFTVGLLDDLLTFRPATKLTLQVVLASAVLAAGVRLDWTGSLTIDSVLTVFWLIGLTNAFNLVDNMDGACAGVGAIAAGMLVVIAGGTGPAASISAALCGALVGFLIYNFHPATIFLGDSGSLFIGFLLAGLSALAGETTSLPASTAAVPILVLLVPIFDTTLVTISRKLAGRPASRGGTDHTAHRLVALGFTEKRAVLFLYAMAFASGAGAVLLLRVGTGSEALLALLGVALLLLGVALLRVPVYGGEEFSRLLGGRWRGAIAALLLRHHVFEVVLDVALVTASYYAAYWVRFDQAEFAFFFPTFLSSLPVVIACKIVSLRLAGAYGGMWRYFGTSEIVPVLNGVGLGSVMAVLSLAYLYRFERVSRSVLLIDGLLLAALLIGSRLAFRLLPASGDRTRRRVRKAIAYGAGDAGEMLARELLNNPRHSYSLVAFVDDDPYKHGRRIRGVPVVGGLAKIDSLLDGDAEAVILTTKKLPAASIQTARAACEAADVPLLEFSCVLREVGNVRGRKLPSASTPPRPESAELNPPATGT